jgi:glycosyltransferase involved in cell wall biosynthesis
MQGDLGEDRKNIGLVIKSFYETFKNKMKKPALILKTSQVGSSYIDREDVLRKIASIKKTMKTKNLPNIYLLNGELTDEEMSQLYNHPKVKAMISLTKGEGFGRPLLEFSLVKKPIIVSGWSGHLDFMDKELSVLLGGELTPVHPSAANQYLIKESQWFSPDPIHIGHFLKDVYENYKNYIVKAKKLGTKNKNEFSREKMTEKLVSILNRYVPEFPQLMQLKLPQLKKIELPKLKKVETDAK